VDNTRIPHRIRILLSKNQLIDVLPFSNIIFDLQPNGMLFFLAGLILLICIDDALYEPVPDNIQF
jgi:hypothetical protein